MRWHDGELEPSLALAAYLLWKDVEWGVGVEPSSRGAEWTELPGNRKRLAATSPVLLNYRWPWDAERAGRGFRHCTRASLAAIAAAGKKELLETILIVAEIEREGPGSTPLGNEQPKALLHSTAINDLIQQSSLQRWPWYADALLLGFAVVGCVALRRVRSPRIVLAIWLCGGALLLLGSFVVIVKTNTVPGAMLAMTGWTTVCLLAATQRVLPSARELPVVPAGHLHFEVFISAASPSYGLAREVHDFLLAHGIAAFFCRRSLLQIGNANFGVAIDDALEQAAHMVVVATHAEDFRRGWFAREWRIFLEEMHSGRKGAGNLIMVSDGSLTPEKLPPPLRLFEMIPAPGGLDPLLAYVRPAADPQPGGPAGSSAPSHA